MRRRLFLVGVLPHVLVLVGWAASLVVALGLLVAAGPAPAHEALRVRWAPRVLRQGDVGMVHVQAAADARVVEGSLAGRRLRFFPYGDGHAALVGIDVETKPGTVAWRVGALDECDRPLRASGTLRIRARTFPLQRLTLPRDKVDLDPPTLARVEEEARRLRTLSATAGAARLWRGRFTKPVGVSDPGEGFGARRIINGQPRAPHTGLDYSADAGTPVVAANRGRVALVADHFFPGRLVVIDHGLGLFTLYFHLERAHVAEGEEVERGQPIGAVGATGRATGPHLHFAAQLDGARIDPAGLFGLTLAE